MSNFFRALSWVNNKKQASPKLAQAFFGKNYFYPDDAETKEKKTAARKEKVKSGAVMPTKEELKEMDSESLRSLKKHMFTKGPGGVTVIANIIEILTERGES